RRGSGLTVRHLPERSLLTSELPRCNSRIPWERERLITPSARSVSGALPGPCRRRELPRRKAFLAVTAKQLRDRATWLNTGGPEREAQCQNTPHPPPSRSINHGLHSGQPSR